MNPIETTDDSDTMPALWDVYRDVAPAHTVTIHNTGRHVAALDAVARAAADREIEKLCGYAGIKRDEFTAWFMGKAVHPYTDEQIQQDFNAHLQRLEKKIRDQDATITGDLKQIQNLQMSLLEVIGEKGEHAEATKQALIDLLTALDRMPVLNDVFLKIKDEALKAGYDFLGKVHL